MHTGGMPIGQFEQFVHNNVYDKFGGFRVVQSRWGRYVGQSHLCTFFFGAHDNGDWVNVRAPIVPEETKKVLGEQGDEVRHFGWRFLLRDFVLSGYIRLGPDIKKALGYEAAAKLEQKANQMGYMR